MKNALIILDSKEMCFILQKMLEDLGFKAQCVDSYEQAKSLCAQEKPLLVLTDININGRSALPLIQENTACVFVCISQKSDPQSIQRALEAGFQEYIMKPFDHDILQSKLSIAGLL